MILQGDMAAVEAGIIRKVFEFAGGHSLLPVVAAQLVLEQLHVVHPVLDVVTPDDDAAAVPLADRLRDVADRCVQSVVCTGGCFGPFPIHVNVIVQHLELRATGTGAADAVRLLNIEKEAAVPPLGHLPFELQLEIVKLLVRNDVAARRNAGQRAIPRLPAVGACVTAKSAPAVGRLAIEQQLPASCTLCVSQSVRLAADCGAGCKQTRAKDNQTSCRNSRIRN